ncbi:MAG: response regulator [Patescibacteria group bacterium]
MELTAPKKIASVLHVDDEADILQVVQTLLTSEGFRVTSVDNGAAALQLLKQQPFDVVLLDIMMPEMSGWELYSRAVKIRADIKVIFMSVLEASPQRISELREYGVRDYITKPFDADDLLARIKKVISE